MIKNSKRVSAYTSCFMEYCLKEICPLLSSGAVNVPFISVSKLVNLKSGFFTNPKSLSLATMLPSSYSLIKTLFGDKSLWNNPFEIIYSEADRICSAIFLLISGLGLCRNYMAYIPSCTNFYPHYRNIHQQCKVSRAC